MIIRSLKTKFARVLGNVNAIGGTFEFSINTPRQLNKQKDTETHTFKKQLVE